MTPVKEKVDAVEAGYGLTGEAGIEAPGTRPEEPEAGRGGRRAGVLLILIGCLFMALAAAESLAGIFL